MADVTKHSRAERIRDVIRYIRKFKNALLVIYIDDEVLDSPFFPNHIQDIGLIHETGLQVIIVPGAHKRIDEILSASNISWTEKNGIRITPPEAMPLIKMAAFDVSNTIMTSLAGEHLNAVIGNWVRARSKGVLDGFDFGTSGEIDKLQIDAIRKVLSNGFIPIFPCIGWSAAGKPYNISSIQLAQEIAIHLQADKLFYLIPHAEINATNFKIPENLSITPEDTIPALSLDELKIFIKDNGISSNTEKITNDHMLKNKILSILSLAQEACEQGVSRVHLLNSFIDGALPCEIFSDLGSGTMIYSNQYGGIRDMTREDIPSVLSLMRPFVRKGILLPRTKQQLFSDFQDYIVYELDGCIRACAALHLYNGGQAEIAGVAVDESCEHIGIGPKIITYLIGKAKQLKVVSIFILTTQSSDWFEQLGFRQDDISSLPQKRKDQWTAKRNSKVFRRKI